MVKNFLCEKLALGGFAARIADGTRRTTRQRNRMMAEQLKPAQRKQRHKIADVQRIRRRVKAAVKRDGRGNFLRQFRRVGAVGDEATPLQFFKNVHRGRINCPQRLRKIFSPRIRVAMQVHHGQNQHLAVFNRVNDAI